MSYAARPSLLKKWDFLQEPLTSYMPQTPPEELKYMSKCSTLFGFLLEACWPATYVPSIQYLAQVIFPLVKKPCEARSFTQTLGEAREQGATLPTSLPDSTLGVPTHFLDINPVFCQGLALNS